MKEFDELKAVKSLFSALEKGEVSAREKGWIYQSVKWKRRFYESTVWNRNDNWWYGRILEGIVCAPVIKRIAENIAKILE